MKRFLPVFLLVAIWVGAVASVLVAIRFTSASPFYHNYYNDYRFEMKIGGEVKGWSDMPMGFGYLDTMTCVYDFRAPDGSKIDRQCYDAHLPVRVHDKYDDK